jgi:hypothetical protein
LFCGEVAVAETFTVIVIGSKLDPPARESLRVQVNVATVQAQLVPAIAVTVSPPPDGGISLTVTVPLVAPALAPFDTFAVYVAPCWPCVKFPVCDFVITSACAATVTVGVGVTFTADAPPPERLSGMLTGVPLPAVTFPVTVIGGKLCPAPTELLYVQVVVANVQVQFVPLIAVTWKPVGGSTTVTVPLVAAAPVLETVIV